MNVTVKSPTILLHSQRRWRRSLRRALEAFGLEEYKSARITQNQLRRLLGFANRYELDGFSKTSVARQTPSETGTLTRRATRHRGKPCAPWRIRWITTRLHRRGKSPARNPEKINSRFRYRPVAFARKIRERVEPCRSSAQLAAGGGAIPLACSHRDR